MLNELKRLAHEVIAIQTQLVESRTAYRVLQQQNEQQCRAMLLDILEVMDLLNLDAGREDQGVLLKKVKKRLENVLRKHGIQEMDTLAEGVQIGKVKVVGTEAQTGLTPGQIIRLVRKGYSWKGQNIRPAEVITALG